MDKQMNSMALGTGQVLGAAVLWGTVGPAQVLSASPLGPAALGGWRLLVGAAVLAIPAALRRRSLRALATREALIPLLVCAVASGLYQVAFLYSVSLTGAAMATVVALGTAPVATGLCERLVGGRTAGVAWYLSTAAAVAGCALLLAPGGGTSDVRGVLLAVAAGAIYGPYTLCAKRLAENPSVHLPTAAAVSVAGGALTLAPWMALDTAGLSQARSLGLVLWLGVATTGAAYWLFWAGLARLGAATAATLCLVEPLAAAALGLLVLGEHLSAVALCGCGLLLCGLAAGALPRPHAAARRIPRPRDLPQSEVDAAPDPSDQELTAESPC